MSVIRVLAAGCWSLLIPLVAAGADELRKSFEQPPGDARIMMRWWWFGPSVTNTELERELRAMKAGGIGGVEIQPVYPLSLDNPDKGIQNLRYLSPEFLDALAFAAGKARELGLRVDLTLGSGWPYGGPHIGTELAAPRIRVEKGGGDPRLREGEKVIARIPEKGLAIIESRTRQMVKRSSVGAEGLVLDHYNRQALDKHLEAVGEPLLKAFGTQPPYAVFCDSLEAFGSDWTGDLLAEFEKRRGYDLTPYLAALVQDEGEKTGAVRNDWALTLTELAEERFLKPAREWARRHGTLFRAQTYGTPPVTLSSQRYVDLADGEQAHWKSFSSARWASSANHILGRKVTATETWTWLHSPSFAATPLDVKAEADRHFLEGINQLIGHGWPYSPPGAGKPGWAFYAAAVFNDNNPWWIVMPDVSLYLQRLSWLMRQGKPVADVALYIPVSDTRARFTAGTGRVSVDRIAGEVMGPAVIPQILEAGYAFDGVDDGLLDEALRNGYRIVVLPNVERIPAASYRRLEKFAKEGGFVVAVRRKPALGPGLMNAAKESEEIRAITARLFENGKGVFVADDTALGVALAKLVKPDVEWAPASAHLGFAHRRVSRQEIYFVANTGNTPYKGKLSFRVSGSKAERWDPMTGKVAAHDDAVELPPYGSLVVVFGGTAGGAKVQKAASPAEQDLSSGWKVSYEGTGRTVEMAKLRSWTEDAETRFYSGTAVYEKEFTLSVPAAGKVELDFGEDTPTSGPAKQAGMQAWLAAPVRDAAVVYVNGKSAGSVWAPPYRLEVSGLVKTGRNSLRIVVANTALNQLAERGEPDYRAVNAKYGERFQMQDMKNMKPEPSGLLGTVRLRAR